MSADRSVAVCLGGWLGRPVPGHGSSLRTHVVDVLHADVFVAATYRRGDCPGGGGDCLLGKLRKLRPFAGVDVAPMLSLAELRARVTRFPRFAAVAAAYNNASNINWLGLNPFAPVLGNAASSVLRQLHDYSRSYRQVGAAERARGRGYAWLVHTRWETTWLAPHVPLRILDPSVLWVPPRKEDGVNDRHALMPREHAGVYFRRWELLQRADLLEIIPIERRPDPTPRPPRTA